MADRQRSKLEIWLDKYNHIMELVRTIVGLASLVASTLVLLKVFGII